MTRCDGTWSSTKYHLFVFTKQSTTRCDGLRPSFRTIPSQREIKNDYGNHISVVNCQLTINLVNGKSKMTTEIVFPTEIGFPGGNRFSIGNCQGEIVFPTEFVFQLPIVSGNCQLLVRIANC